jgi:hypothetical protein
MSVALADVDEPEFMAFEVDNVAVERLGQDGCFGDLAREVTPTQTWR